MIIVNGIDIELLRKSVEDGYSVSSATTLELIKHARRYLFFSRCDSQIRLAIADSENIGAGWEWLDKAIDEAIIS